MRVLPAQTAMERLELMVAPTVITIHLIPAIAPLKNPFHSN
jgi:hypothetical protein